MILLERGQILRRAAIGVCCALISLWPSDSQAADAEETIMVLDASRSMWGTIARTSKRMMVHDAFARAFENHETNVPRMGLVTFGNRSPSQCSDITLQFAPNAAGTQEFLSAIKGIKPWGLTPIAGALKRAAQAFSSTAKSTRIVLVADGLENCRGNPCETALKLKEQSAGLTIDVIALGVAKKDLAQLSCISTATGGTFLTASSQAELNTASSRIIEHLPMTVASASPSETETADTPASETIKPPLALLRGPAPLPRAHPMAHLRKFAQLKPQPKPGSQAWRLLTQAIEPPVMSPPDAQPGQVAEAPDAMPRVETPAPSNDPPATEVAAALAEADPPATQAIEEVAATTQDDAPAPPDPAPAMQVAEAPPADPLADDPAGTDLPAPPVGNPAAVLQDEAPVEADPLQTAAIPTKGDPAKQSPLSEGQIRALPERPSAPDGSVRKSQEPDAARTPSPLHKPEFNIRNQSTPERQGIKLRAKLTAEMRQIGRPVEWSVYKVENIDQALWKQVTAVRASEPTIKLPPGRYLVRARYGYVTASKMIDVTKGKLVDATFVLNAGGLRILSHLVFVDTPSGMAATHFIYTGDADENGMRQLIAKSDVQGDIIRLNAGKYRVISRLGDANSVVSTDVEVNPGVLTAVEINHKAGVLTLQVDDSSGQSSSTTANMVVFDANGKLVTRVRGGKTTTILAPGRYTVSVERAGKKVTKDVNIRIGEDKAVSLDPQ